jgi:ABC-type uncharacterized transport system substrate-binding protein
MAISRRCRALGDGDATEQSLSLGVVTRGRSPATFRSKLPTKYTLVINLKTAKTLGLIVPDKLLARAGDVIE